MTVLNCTGKIFTAVADKPVMWIMLIFMPLIAIFGLVGNTLSFIILKDSSSKVSSFLYIRCLTIFDSLSLIFTMFGFYAALVLHPMLMVYPSYEKISYIWVYWGTCQLRTYLAFTSRTLSIWTIVIFTVERFVCIRFPLLSMKFCNVRTAKFIVIILAGVSLLSNISWIFSFKKVACNSTGLFVCRPKPSMMTFRILDMVMLSVIPSMIIIICNVVIILTLKERRRHSLVAFEDELNKNRDMKITVQLLTVSSTFTLLTIPHTISVIINTAYEFRNSKAYLLGNAANFYHISFLLFTLNFAINFVLYCFIGVNFRKAATNLILCQFHQMKVLRRAIFETVSNDTKNTTLSKCQIKKNSVVSKSDHIKLNTMHKEQNPLIVQRGKPLQYGRLGPETVSFNKMVQGHIKIDDSQMIILGLSDFSSIRANCCVYAGKWFYEVRLWSRGVMQLGWCTENCKFSEENGVGDTVDSYGFDGNRVKLWSVLSKKYGEAWDIGDVISCCIDLDEGTLEYFRNGKSLGIIRDKIRIGPGIVYYPAISISQGDSITINFGGSMFLYQIDGYKPLQHQNIQNLVKTQCLMGYLERLIPITVDCLKIGSVGDNQKIVKEVYSEENIIHSIDDQISNQCCCWLIARNLLTYLESHICNRFINETCLIPLLLKFCDISNLKCDQSHVILTLDMLWNLLEKESVTIIIDWLLSGIVTLYQCTPISVNLRSQEKYLYLVLAIVKHQKTKLYILESALFEKLKLPVIMHIRTPDDEILEKLVSGNYWGYSVCVLEDCVKHKLLENLPQRQEFINPQLKSQFIQSINLMQIQIRELEDIQSEILIQLITSNNPVDDETELTLRTLFVQQLYRYLRININNVESVSDYSCSLIMSFFHRLVNLIRHLWKEAMIKFSDLPNFEDISIPISLYAMPPNNCIQLNSLRISGRLNQLTKTFKSDLDTLLNKNFKKSEKRNFIGFKKNSEISKLFDLKNKKSRIPNKIHDIILEERSVAISNYPVKSQSVSACKISSSPSKETSTTSELSMNSTSFFSFFPAHIRVEPLSLFTGLNRNSTTDTSVSSDENVFSCQLDFVLGDITSCLQLIQAADVFYYLGANEHLNKILSIRNQSHNYIVAIRDIDDRIERCPETEHHVSTLLKSALKLFENKLRVLSRSLAFIRATILSEEKRDDILWLWTTTLATLDENKTDKLYGFLPTYHIENCLNIFRHITTIFHPTLQLEGLRDCFNVLGQHGMMVMFNYRDKRINQSNLRNQMMKGIVDVINLPVAIKCLEERICPLDATNFLQSLLTDWADAMIILEKFWRGDGFAFRYQDLPHQQLPEFHLRDAVIKSFEKPNPSKIFQNHLKNLLKENNSVATSFIDLLLTKINWSFSEVVSNMQELNQYKSSRIDRLTDIRFIRTCSLCFDITVSLLRILEMIVSLVPELFVDFTRPNSEMFLDRLFSSISQIFNRCLNKGLFHKVISFKINGLDQLHYFPITIGALGVLVALVLDSPQKIKSISSGRLVEIMIKESNFAQLSLVNIVSHRSDEISETHSSVVPDNPPELIFNLNEYSSYINDEERKKIELIMDMIQKECAKTSDVVNKEDDLCTICYAHQKSVIFKPCDHSSCKNCITYQMMSNPRCFFCKAKINKVEDFSGKDLHIKPNKSSTD